MTSNVTRYSVILPPFNFAFSEVRVMSALSPKADIVQHGGNVRFVPKQTHSTAANGVGAVEDRDPVLIYVKDANEGGRRRMLE